jgi:dCMP deaminase
MRPGWDRTWIAVAGAIAARSACSVRRVGAVVVTADNAAHWAGYNGPPAGLQEAVNETWDPRGSGACGFYCPQGSGRHGSFSEPHRWFGCPSVHAEVNALMKSDPDRRRGGTVYVTAAPCWKCALAVANSGAARLVSPPWEADRQALAQDVRNLYELTGTELCHDW